MSIVGNWHRELQRFAPSLKVMIHHGHERLSGAAFVEEAMRNDIVVTTYSLALRDREHLASIEWKYVVVDEAQNIKNEAAKQSQAIKALNARHKIALTGTPVENRLSELWSIMEFLNPGYLGLATAFRQQFAIPVERYRDADRAETLKRVIEPFVLRRLKTDKSIIADLPDKMEMRVFCNLTQEQATLYEAVVKEMMEKNRRVRGHRAQGTGPCDTHEAQADLQSPGQFVGDGSALPGARASWRAGRDARGGAGCRGQGADLQPVRGDGRPAAPLSAGDAGLRGAFPAWWHTKKQRDSMVQRFRSSAAGGASLPSSSCR